MRLDGIISRIAVSAALAVVLTACSLIDEDQSDCGKEVRIYYELRLITNLSIELQMQLDPDSDKDVIEALRNYLKNIFTDYAHDVDLSFYDSKADSARLHHEQAIMNANQRSYTLYLPMREYMHLAVANVMDNQLVSLTADEFCHPSRLQQAQADTITPHTTGLFTARQPITVVGDEDQTFLVRLYMANCAAALVVDTQGNDASGMKVISSGFASRFSICDSTFVFDDAAPVMLTDDIPVKGGRQKLFCSVNFPSKDTPPLTPPLRGAGNAEATRTIIETEEPFLSQPSETSLWEFRVYVPRPASSRSGSEMTVTESILRFNKPLDAGQLKVVKVRLRPDGGIEAVSPEVGVSVTLDWKPGGVYNPEF